MLMVHLSILKHFLTLEDRRLKLKWAPYARRGYFKYTILHQGSDALNNRRKSLIFNFS